MLKKILFVSMCLMPSLVHATTLKDVLAYTYNNSWSINADRAELKATDENVAIAKSGFRPNVAAVGSIGRTYNKNKYEISNYK